MTKKHNEDRHPNAPIDNQPAQAQGQQEQPKAQQVPPPLTIAKQKKNVIEKLTLILTSPTTGSGAVNPIPERLLRMAGGDASRVAKNLTAFLSVISQDEGGSKKDKFYFMCSLSSLTTCFLESMNMQLPFDSRQLVCMVIYDWQAELDISYKGFVNALSRHYRNAFVECKLVFEKDHFPPPKLQGRTVSFEHSPENPFALITSDFKDIKGGYCYFSYTDHDGLPTSRLVFLSKEQILANKRRARTDYVWKSDPKAMAEKTCIREGAKLPFAAIDLDIDIEEIGNRHYQLEKPEGNDRLKLLMAAQEEVVHGKPASNDDTATSVNSDSKPAPADDGKKPEAQGAGLDKSAGTDNAGDVSANNDKPAEIATAVKPATGSDNTLAGTGNNADGDEHAHAVISDADFEDVNNAK